MMPASQILTAPNTVSRVRLEWQLQEALARLEQQEERADEAEQKLQRLEQLDVRDYSSD